VPWSRRRSRLRRQQFAAQTAHYRPARTRDQPRRGRRRGKGRRRLLVARRPHDLRIVDIDAAAGVPRARGRRRAPREPARRGGQAGCGVSIHVVHTKPGAVRCTSGWACARVAQRPYVLDGVRAAAAGQVRRPRSRRPAGTLTAGREERVPAERGVLERVRRLRQLGRGGAAERHGERGARCVLRPQWLDADDPQRQRRLLVQVEAEVLALDLLERRHGELPDVRGHLAHAQQTVLRTTRGAVREAARSGGRAGR
jgi:hypothetical protein